MLHTHESSKTQEAHRLPDGGFGLPLIRFPAKKFRSVIGSVSESVRVASLSLLSSNTIVALRGVPAALSSAPRLIDGTRFSGDLSIAFSGDRITAGVSAVQAEVCGCVYHITQWTANLTCSKQIHDVFQGMQSLHTVLEDAHRCDVAKGPVRFHPTPSHLTHTARVATGSTQTLATAHFLDKFFGLGGTPLIPSSDRHPGFLNEEQHVSTAGIQVRLRRRRTHALVDITRIQGQHETEGSSAVHNHFDEAFSKAVILS